MQQIWNRLQLMCALGVSTLVSKDKVQAKVLDGEVLDNIARIEPYGFSYKPKVGSQTYMMFPAGDRSYGVALIVGDKRYQMDLADGEVALHDDLGHSVALKRAGIAVAGGGHNVSVTGSPKVVVTGGDVIADGISLKNHLHNSMGLPVDGSNDGGETDGSPNSGGDSQALNDAVTAADVSAVAAQQAYALAILAKNDAIEASTAAILAQGAALIAKGLAEGFAQTASSNYDLTVESKDLAGGYANSALTYKNEASAAALAAEGSASTAVNQVMLATEQKTLASDFASAALDSKNSASSFASAAGDSATLASQQLTLATEQKTLASGFADAALSFKNTAQTFATSAGDSATLASQQATIATSQTSAASGYAGASLQYRNEASTSATNAANSAQAAAIQYTDLSTTVGGHTSSISELTTSKNGLEARWGLTINNNGHISGIALNSVAAANGGNPMSAVVISADKFLIVDPSVPYTQGNNPSQANVPFYVVNGVTYIKEANIADLTVGTNHIKQGAVHNVEALTFLESINNVSAILNAVRSFSSTYQVPAAIVNIKSIIIISASISHLDNIPGLVSILVTKYVNGNYAGEVGEVTFHPSAETVSSIDYTATLFDDNAAFSAVNYQLRYRFINAAATTWSTQSALLKVRFTFMVVKRA